MTDITRRRIDIGPSSHYTRVTGEVTMANVATEDTYVVDAVGVRRQIKKGHPIPSNLGLDAKGEVKRNDEVFEPAVSAEDNTAEAVMPAARASSRRQSRQSAES